MPSGVAPSRTRCWVCGRCPTLSNIILRLSTSLTGLPSCRAAAAASAQCVHGNSLPPKPEPRYREITRTFSFGSPNICAMTLRAFTTPCVESYTVSDDGPSQIAVVACSSMGLWVSGGRHVGLVELHRRARERAVGVAALALNARLRTERGRDHGGSSSAVRCGSTFGRSARYCTRTAAAAAVAASNVSATASATYWP